MVLYIRNFYSKNNAEKEVAMPCDIGYKSIARIRVKPRMPSIFKERVEAPKIDKELSDNMGVDDAEFLEWASELDTTPLLNEALRRALA